MSLLYQNFTLNDECMKFYSFVDPLTCVLWTSFDNFILRNDNSVKHLARLYFESSNSSEYLTCTWRNLIRNYKVDQIEVPMGWNTNALMISESSVTRILDTSAYHGCKSLVKWFKIICRNIIKESGFSVWCVPTNHPKPLDNFFIMTSRSYSIDDVYVLGTCTDIDSQLEVLNYGRLREDEFYYILVSRDLNGCSSIVETLLARLVKHIINTGGGICVSIKIEVLYDIFQDVSKHYKKILSPSNIDSTEVV